MALKKTIGVTNYYRECLGTSDKIKGGINANWNFLYSDWDLQII